jgi:hypothetical protein
MTTDRKIESHEVWDNLDEWVRTVEPPYRLQTDPVYLTGMICELLECDPSLVEPHVISWVNKG